MKDASAIHPLAEDNKPSGKIRFIHSDGSERTFVTVVNRLTGSRMSYFAPEAPSIDDPIVWVKSVFRDIRAKCQVLETVGDF